MVTVNAVRVQDGRLAQQEITTADITKLQVEAATRSQDIEMLASPTASMDATLDAIMSNIG